MTGHFVHQTKGFLFLGKRSEIEILVLPKKIRHGKVVYVRLGHFSNEAEKESVLQD